MPEFKENQGSSGIIAFFVEILKEYSNSSNFLFYFPEVMMKFSKQHKFTVLANNLSHNLKLPIGTQIAIALSFYLSDRA